MQRPEIRIASADDHDAIFALIEKIYVDFGYVASREHGEADLVDLQTHYFNPGGCFWVLDDAGHVVGTHGYLPGEPGSGVCTFRRLYLDHAYRGTDWGTRLMQVTIDWAKARGMRRVEFWSDVQFARAHRFFDKFGFTITDQRREMNDGLQPYQEWFCYLELD